MPKNYQREGRVQVKGYGGDNLTLEGANGNWYASAPFSLGAGGAGKVAPNLGGGKVSCRDTKGVP